MKMAAKFLLLAVATPAAVLTLGVMVYLEFSADSTSPKMLAGRVADRDGTRQSSRVGNSSEARGRNGVAPSRRSKAANRAVSNRIARRRTGGDAGSKAGETGGLESEIEALLPGNGPGTLPSDGRKRGRGKPRAEREKAREQMQSEEKQDRNRPKGPGRRNLEQFQAYWESKDAVEQQMDPQAYEKMLYDKGEANSVSVEWVSPGSTAARAGLQPGDVIVSYAGKRVYQPGAVRLSNTKTGPGQPIEIEFYRDGKLYSTVMTRDATRNALRGNINGLRIVGKKKEP